MSKLYDGKLVCTTQSARRVSIANFMGIDVPYPEKSTLNEVMQHIHQKMPRGDENNKLRYLCVGDRGHGVEVDTSGIPDFKPVRHFSIHSGPYGIRPLVLRPVDNDLSDEERKRYAFRIKVEFEGRLYWAYYLKRLDMRTVTISDTETIKEGDDIRTDTFRYTEADMKPTPPTLKEADYDTVDRIEIPDGRYVRTAATLQLRFDAFDIAEFQNVARILRGDPGNATISEIMLCSGVDVDHTGESTTGSPFVYKDAYGVQISYFLTTYANLAITDERSTYTFEIGQSVPTFLGL